MDKQKELNRIAQEIRQCASCRRGGVGEPVPGEGSAGALVMFVGEAPGKSEAKTGRPFTGRSGQYLRKMIREIGLREGEIFFTSPVHYLPAAGKPSRVMIDHGRTHLLRQINIIKPRIIVLLGNTACRALLGKNVGIAREHGNVVEQDGIRYFISFHPAYADRFPKGGIKFNQDFLKLKELVKNM